MEKWKVAVVCGIAVFLIFFFLSRNPFFEAVAGLGAFPFTPAEDATKNSPVFMSLGYLAMFFTGGISITLIQGKRGKKNKNQRDNDLLRLNRLESE